MLSHDEIQVLLVHRVFAAIDSCNSHHINHVKGQISAILAILGDGKKPLFCDAVDALRVGGVPVIDREDGGFDVPDEWLIERGCRIEDGAVLHPKFSGF